MNTQTDIPDFRTLDDSTNLRDNYANAYYLENMKWRIAVARIGTRLFAFDDLYEGCPLSSGLLAGTTLMSQYDGSLFDLSNGAVKRGPAKSALKTYEVREQAGKIQVRI
jgi:nitrite reductase/ring-hydroxylating ferredoxin subunit